MDTNRILSADLLDLVFDNRNKEYGAYELRKNYHVRVTKALIFGGLFVVIVFTGVVMANKIDAKEKIPFVTRELTIQHLPEDIKPKPIPEPQRRIEQPPVQTIQHANYRIVDDTQVDEPLPTQDDLVDAVIDTKTIEGNPPDGTVLLEATVGENKGVVQEQVVKYEGPLWDVDEDATYDGWGKFLERNLRGSVPVDNDAPAGSYTVVVQFVVDIDGSISNIKALTNHGYGLEEEATRVIKKATKWKPAFQQGRPVKAFRKQPITFVVEE